jgi:signal transduction histidine kinase
VDLIKTEERLHNLINQTKKLTQDLLPVNLDEFGLNAALRQYVREVSETPGTNCHPTFRVEGAEVPRLPNVVEVALFRSTQNALTNACQHAPGSEITVTARVRGPRNKPQLIEIEISDRGPGFDPRQSLSGRPSTQLGLAAMQERLLLVGAGCEIISAPGQGTRVILSYNMPDENL